MSARSYMSIGDVLSLLRQEFPDVTISKIRFLESQGLVNPERTPSGYRKFYEHDVERLRWVLRQQREHFLPLKVIKDRLEDDPSGSQATEAPRVAAAVVDTAAADSQHHAEDAAPPRPVLVGQHAVVERGAGSTLPGIEPAMTSTTGGRSTTVGGPDGPSTNATSRTPEAATVARPPTAAGADPHAPVGGAPVGSAARRSSRSSGGSAESSSQRGKPATSPPPGAEEPAGDAPVAGNSVTDPTRPASKEPRPSSGRSGGVGMSAEELASACGMDVAVVRELEEFGLVTASNVAGVESFGEDALAVGQLAAQFARFGIEPRHLRLYKNAADREAGFVEQIVLPLVRQRNPDARARAHEAADELAQLGQQLRSTLLRTALGNLVDG